MDSVLFLSHALHDAHRGFAEAIGAQTVSLPFEPYIRLIKRFPPLRYAYPLLTSLYGMRIAFRGSTIIADGASSLFTSLSVKKKVGGGMGGPAAGSHLCTLADFY